MPMILVAALLAGLLALVPGWLDPRSRLIDSHRELLEAVGDADRTALESLLSDDYSDAWGQDKAAAVDLAMEAARQFLALEIRQTSLEVEMGGLEAACRLQVGVEGSGTPAADLIRERVARLREPFRLEWRREAWKPWSWRLTRLANPEVRRLGP